jgi:lipopolysaccharide/colanic/teichoic acid biosynthesis glycosyltransferase
MKRTFDILVSAFALVMLLPVLFAIAVAIIMTMGRTVIFRQPRPGLHGRPFQILKFRTMTNKLDEAGKSLADEARITGLGHFLRRTSLDELPELWNVLKGDMSLVGPRPLLMEYLSLYSPTQMRRHEVRPGLTGWAQVNGRNALDWGERFEYDVWYVDNQSCWLDLTILQKTVRLVLNGDGVTTADGSAMPKFVGRQSDGERKQ